MKTFVIWPYFELIANKHIWKQTRFNIKYIGKLLEQDWFGKSRLTNCDRNICKLWFAENDGDKMLTNTNASKFSGFFKFYFEKNNFPGAASWLVSLHKSNIRYCR